MNTILFLAASPRDQVRLALPQEVNKIDNALQLSRHRDQFKLEQQHAVNTAVLQQLLLRFRPQIVQFSGHGSEDSALVFEEEDGTAIKVPQNALTELFRIVNTEQKNIQCVFLNACYSEDQAEAIGKHIPCVIGMSDEITDVAATKFATSFYRGLGDGRSIKNAFELGLNQLDLESIPESATPKLKYAPGVDPAQVILVTDTNSDRPTDTSSALEDNIKQLLKDPNYLGRSITTISRRQHIADNQARDILFKLGATKIEGPDEDEEYWGLPTYVIESLFETSEFPKLSFEKIWSCFPELSDDKVRDILREMHAQAFESDDGVELWQLH